MQKLGGVLILMKNVNYMIGSENITTSPLVTYNDEVCKFLNDLSSEILKSSISRVYPDLSAVAFWARKASIHKLKEKFGDTSNRTGRGLCFHIAPSNIPVNFAFSYFFSLLAGNANIVRLPSKDFPQTEELVKVIKNTLEKYPSIYKRTAFVKYERNNEVTSEFSKIADCRMIWGGDKTISILRMMETKPRCIDISFADRYSICIIEGQEVLEADDSAIKRLAENFYNDTYLMDQNACSSPKLIYWLNDSELARTKFWTAVLEIAKQKYQLQDAVAVDKYTKMCEDSIDNSSLISKIDRVDNLLYKAELRIINKDVQNLRGNGGYFYEYSLSNIEDLFNIVDEKYQTVTYYGIDAQKLADDITKHNLKGIDRIVPIGKAMDIEPYWDGHDIIRELSREIAVR